MYRPRPPSHIEMSAAKRESVGMSCVLASLLALSSHAFKTRKTGANYRMFRVHVHFQVLARSHSSFVYLCLVRLRLKAANEPGGPPPNVSWWETSVVFARRSRSPLNVLAESDRSENLIFGNMYVSSVQKFMDFHASAAQGSEETQGPPLSAT